MEIKLLEATGGRLVSSGNKVWLDETRDYKNQEGG